MEPFKNLEQLPHNSIERHVVLRGMLHPLVGIGFNRSSDAQGIAGWGIWPLSLIVGQHGVEDFDGGMALLREMTQRSTAEFAIRYFMIADQERALAIIAPWVVDPNEDVRRLASEGTRPRLPCGMRLLFPYARIQGSDHPTALSRPSRAESANQRRGYARSWF